MRRVRTAIAMISGLLFAVLVILWIRSYTLGESIGCEYRDTSNKVTRITGVFSAGGQLACGTLQVEHPDFRGGWYQKPVESRYLNWRRDFVPYPLMTETAHEWLRILGIGRSQIRQGQITRHVIAGIGVPYWMMALVTGLLPAWILTSAIVRSIRYHERLRQGRCLRCGYDLRGSPRRCPECGNQTV